MRMLCVAAAALTLGLFVAISAPNQPGRAERMKKIEKRFEEEMADMVKRLGKAKSAAEVRGIQAEMREQVAISAERALDLAKDDPKDATGFGACEFLVRIAGQTNVEGLMDVDTGAAILAEHHAANPKIKPLLLSVLNLGKAGDRVFEAVSEKGADKETKVLALLLLGYRATQTAYDQDDESKLKAAVEKANGYLDRAAKEAPDEKLRGRAISEHAADLQKELKGVKVLAIGKPAPEIESVTVDGELAKLSKYKGKVVLLDFWATWCGPCQQMIPHAREMVKRMKGRPFEMIGISADDEKQKLDRFLEQVSMPWTHWWDDGSSSAAFRRFRVNGYPNLYLIDHNGIVRQRWLGVPGNDPNSDELDKAVEALVKEAEKAK